MGKSAGEDKMTWSDEMLKKRKFAGIPEQKESDAVIKLKDWAKAVLDKQSKIKKETLNDLRMMLNTGMSFSELENEYQSSAWREQVKTAKKVN